MVNEIIYTVLTDNYIPPIILGEETVSGIVRQWIIDGLQRSSSLSMFRYGNTKITKSLDECIVTYQRKILDGCGNTQRDENAYVYRAGHIHSVWKNISIRYMEEAKAIVKTEVLHMADMQCSKANEKFRRCGWIIRLSHGKDRKRKMSKYYIIIAHDGTEVIDNTVEAEEHIATMDYLESRYKRVCERRNNCHGRFVKNPLYRLACLCGMV